MAGQEAFKQWLEGLYEAYNKREYVPPDPLQLVYEYDDPRDMEVAGLVASSFAFGRVSQILKAASGVLSMLGKHPYISLVSQHFDMPGDFRYRFVDAKILRTFLKNLGRVLMKYGSLENAFLNCNGPFLERVSCLLGHLHEGARIEYLLPKPDSKGANKRFFLFFRWMVRRDAVDLGIWSCLEPRDLIVPLDTHLFGFSRDIGLTKRRNPDLKAAMEVTEAFKRICPEDPVRYDFVLTRFGIRPDLDIQELKASAKAILGT